MSVPPSAREEAEANAAVAAMIADAAASGKGGWVAQMLQKLEPLATPALIATRFTVNTLAPVYSFAFRGIYKLYETLPFDLFQSLLGLGLAFCGGGYCASIAAVEAFRMCGWERTRSCLIDLHGEAVAVLKANDEDEARRAASGEPQPPADVIKRKISLAAVAIKEPNRLANALGGVYAAWLAVQGTLRLEFAKVITLALSLAEMVTPVALKLGVPVLSHLIDEKYHHWIPLLIRSGVRALTVALSWRLQVFVSAVHLAMRGGLLFSRSLLRFAQSGGFLGGYFSKLDPSKTYADEVVGYAVAGCGFYFQLSNSFGLPFPLSIFMWPLDLVEWYIRWSITSPEA